MKNTIKLALVGALLAAGITQSNAQSVTNLVQKLTLKFTGYYQLEPEAGSGRITRSVKKVSLANKDIINLLALQVNVIFSTSAKLLLLTPAASPEAPELALERRIVVRDVVNGKDVDVDVSQYFSLRLVESVEDSRTRVQPYNIGGTSYTIAALHMHIDAATFEVQGFGKTSLQAVDYANVPVGKSHSGTFDVSGSGVYAATAAGGEEAFVLTGTVRLSGKDAKLETP